MREIQITDRSALVNLVQLRRCPIGVGMAPTREGGLRRGNNLRFYFSHSLAGAFDFRYWSTVGGDWNKLNFNLPNQSVAVRRSACSYLNWKMVRPKVLHIKQIQFCPQLLPCTPWKVAERLEKASSPGQARDRDPRRYTQWKQWGCHTVGMILRCIAGGVGR